MALQMDPDRRRRLEAIDRWRDEWAAKYGIDDIDWTPDGSDGPDRRSPTPEQALEFVRKVRELSGQDPDTGRYLD